MIHHDKPLAFMSKEEMEDAWDDIYATEEGIIAEFNNISFTGKIQSLIADSIYRIDSREQVRIKIDLHAGDKVLFAPIQDPDGDHYARIIRIIELNC